jgi:hypothetical protein
VERRSPIAVLLVLLLTMLPLGSAACDVHCGLTTRGAEHALVGHGSADHMCCHASHATAHCSMSQAQDAGAFVATRGSLMAASLTAVAAATVWVDTATEESAARRGVDSLPPGSDAARTQTPLRI